MAGRANPQRWLVKSDPEVFSFDDLWKAPGRRTGWDGVRNYQARNFIRDRMKVGDLALLYHSGSARHPGRARIALVAPGVAGIARVASAPRPDPTQFDPRSGHFDPKSGREAPTWYEVDFQAVAKLPVFVSLEAMRARRELRGMLLLQPGQRLSVMPVTPAEWRVVVALGGLERDAD